MQLHERPVTAREACQPVGGIHARDQRAGNWSMALKLTDRTSANVSMARKVRVRDRVGVTAGYVAAAHPERTMSKNARRKARRYGR